MVGYIRRRVREVMRMAEKRRRDGSKTEDFKIRMSKEDMNKLSYAAQKFDVSMADIIRDGINYKYQMARYKD